nr:hypothetical protein [Amylibacter sp.]
MAIVFSGVAALANAADVVPPETVKGVRATAEFCVTFLSSGKEHPQNLASLGFNKKMGGYNKPGKGTRLNPNYVSMSVSTKNKRTALQCTIWVSGNVTKHGSKLLDTVERTAIARGFKPKPTVRIIGKSRKIKEVVYGKSGAGFTIRGEIRNSTTNGTSVVIHMRRRLKD